MVSGSNPGSNLLDASGLQSQLTSLMRQMRNQTGANWSKLTRCKPMQG
jgi:hypothetical protein